MTGSECAEPLCTTVLRHHTHSDAEGRSWCCEPYPYTAAPVLHSEPTDGLREALIRTGREWLEQPGCTIEQLADALLAGPLTPLLAKLQAVEALAGELGGECREDFANRIRRALGR